TPLSHRAADQPMAASSLFLWVLSFSLARVRNFFGCDAQSIQQRVHGLAQLHCGFVHPKIVEVACKLKEHRERLKLCLPLITPVKGPQGRPIRHCGSPSCVRIPRLCWFQVVYVRLTADEMSGLKPVLKVFGDFLEVFSKRYGATVPIAAGPRAADARAARCC